MMPLTMIAPNMMTVQPPSTQEGRVEKNAPIGGNSPDMMRVMAPNMMVNLFTTFVMATRPTFCENDVIGEQSKTPADTADMKPSQQSDPETSLSVIYMLRKTHTLACGMKAAFLYLDR